MSSRTLRYLSFLVVIPLISAATACSESAPLSPTAADLRAANISVESDTVAPEVIPTVTCGIRPPFRTRIVIIVGSNEDVIVRGLQFGFTDLFGVAIVPTVFPPPTSVSSAASIPNSLPVPIPGTGSVIFSASASVPIPGSTPHNGLIVSGGAPQNIPFLLEFPCGSEPAGILVINVDTMTKGGRSGTSKLSVRVGK